MGCLGLGGMGRFWNSSLKNKIIKNNWMIKIHTGTFTFVLLIDMKLIFSIYKDSAVCRWRFSVIVLNKSNWTFFLEMLHVSSKRLQLDVWCLSFNTSMDTKKYSRYRDLHWILPDCLLLTFVITLPWWTHNNVIPNANYSKGYNANS